MNKKFTVAQLPVGTKVRLKTANTILRKHSFKPFINHDVRSFSSNYDISLLPSMLSQCGHPGQIVAQRNNNILCIYANNSYWAWPISCIKEIIK